MKAVEEGVERVEVRRVEHGVVREAADVVLLEEPLELRVVTDEERTVNLTMRTPGHDEDLALGWLLSEGVISKASDVTALDAWRTGETVLPNVLRATLREGLHAPPRFTWTSSACGVCGIGGLERLAVRAERPSWTEDALDLDLVLDAPRRLRERQVLFDATGGAHGAALFTSSGDLLATREDIGRHNAVDKIVGWALRQAALPLSNTFLVVSGRVGYDIASKAVLAGIPVLVSVSAPSSLAVRLCEAFGVTLLSFVRERRCTVYAGGERLGLKNASPSARKGEDET
ncbi:formate dehydrogenase accessory sulfurtransferase FdhD [Deinococcus yavapaiensis]|uniref:Sulfur carrier protein FdhD n=1 Tax=Deinococcus yavapaiensis KR-236 TaxID=694435 RepID=A0A318S834_9DEIO|nr:formate dehydrogenase accessory sulfurtransferase FdhD [Deinococcus yavapaiensis]PYE51941.1 FdhD protein [Deinococcus yavapaiensis KR-236]